MKIMKKFYYYLVSMLVAAIVAVGCTEDITTTEEVRPEEGPAKELMTVTASLEVDEPAEVEGEESRTTLEDNGNGGKVVWSEGDTIGVISADGQISAWEATAIAGSVAEFNVPVDTKYAFYPYSAKSTYSTETGLLSHTLVTTVTQDGTKQVFDDEQNVMCAHLSNKVLDFKNLCGYVEIKLKGSQKVKHVALRNNSHNKEESLSGLGTIDFSDAENPTFTAGTNHGTTFAMAYASCPDVQLSTSEATSFYVMVPPRTYENMSICVQTDKGSFQISSKNAIQVNRSKIRPLSAINLDSLIPTNVTDLSANGVANCYIVPQGGEAKYYSFPARKINATANLENVAYAHVSWSESATLITNVNYDATTGNVTFKYEGNDAEGNAAIVVLNSNNEILWSWHIWCTDQPRMLAVCGATTTYGILDRDLGATYTPRTQADIDALSATNASDAAGVYYQYGRPTPFPRIKSMSVKKDDAAYGSNTRVAVEYGFAQYNQRFSFSTSANAYEKALSYPKAFYCVRYADATAAATATTGNYYTWYGTKEVYHPYDNSDKLWYSEDANVVSKKVDNDPCPAGYVMDDTNAVKGYINANSYTLRWATGSNTMKYGYYYICPTTESVVWIATAGYRAGTSATMSSVGENFNHWAVSPTRVNNNKLTGVRISLGYGHTAATGKPSVTEAYTQPGQGFTIRCRVIDRTELQNQVITANTFEGEGTEGNPYLIKSSNDLVKLAALCDGSVVTIDKEDFTVAHYALVNDINMNGVTFTPITPFKGSFDGRDNTISNIKVTPNEDASPTGIFGTTEGATIKNLNISGATVIVTAAAQLYTGGVVGMATDTTISKVSFEGTVSSAATAKNSSDCESRNSSAVVGGIVGYAVDSEISEVTYYGTVNSTNGQYVGGIVSFLEGGSVKKSLFAKGSDLYTSMNHVGGVAGFMGKDAEISECTIDAPIRSKNGYIGGVTGRMQSGTISKCLVSSNSRVEAFINNPTSTSYYGTGGIVGKLETVDSKGSVAVIENCACYTNISANNYVGGIVGDLISKNNTSIDVKVSGCVFQGNLSVAYMNSSTYGLSGGLVGCCNQTNTTGNNTKITDCVALIDEIKFNKSATSAGFGGLVGYTKTTDYVRCYTNLDLANMVSIEEGKAISEYTSIKYYGALHGRTSGTSQKNNFTNVYYLTGQKKGQEAATSETNVESLSISQMTDGTLLNKLKNAGGSWVANADGYPVPTAAPANVGPSTSVTKTRVSIIGDSISTFEGWMPSGYVKFYPIASNPTVVSASQTYWYKLIYKYMSNAMLDMNIAWSGTVVARSTDETYLASDHGAGHCFVERFRDDGMGNPDVIILHGGTNDVGNRGKSIAVHPNYPIYGATDYTKDMCPTDAELAAVFAAADAETTWDGLLELNDTSFVEAYVKLLSMMHNKYPTAKVVMVIGDWIHAGTRQAILKIASHYGTKYGYKCVDLQEISPYASYDVIPKESGCHPNEAGFEVMANYIYQKAGSYIDPAN
ncbi:MAG: hypothetical protein IJW42_04575 [Alistipes sp.]|nr:hypothetical protein [Alistipes sp.]